jgi:hypothetical protein
MGSVHYDGRDNIREGLTHERQSYSQPPPALPNWRSVFYDRRLFCDIQYRSAFCSLSSKQPVTAVKLALINLRASFIYFDGGRMRGA